MLFDVDPARVRALAVGLRSAGDTVAALDGRTVVRAADLGSPLVSGALEDASAGWSLARRRVLGELETLARAAATAAAAYDAADGAVRQALVPARTLDDRS